MRAVVAPNGRALVRNAVKPFQGDRKSNRQPWCKKISLVAATQNGRTLLRDTARTFRAQKMRPAAAVRKTLLGAVAQWACTNPRRGQYLP